MVLQFDSHQIQIPQWLKKMFMMQPGIIKEKGVGEERLNFNESYRKL